MQNPDQDKNWCIVILKFIAFYWRGVILIIWPFISALVFLISFEKKIRCLFVVVLMAGYWVTECIPLYVTGLIPVIILPLLEVQSTADVCFNYMNRTNMIFLASILIAIGIEHSGLHRRIAYGTIMAMGCSPRKLHFGLTMVTALLSMWLINAAATAMMCPVITAVLSELEAQGIGSVNMPKKPTDKEDDKPRPTNITIGYFLSAAYASSIGGIGSLVGTGTNLTYKGIYETRFPTGDKIDFVPWLLFNVPPMLMMVFVCWITIEWIFMGLWRPKSEEALIIKAGNANQEAAYNVMKKKMAELGRMSWGEICVLVLFVLCILLWFFRKPQFIPGWGDLYTIPIADATPAIGVVFFFAAIPASLAFFSYCTKDKTARPDQASQSLVPWKVLQDKMPWGLLFLLGGGFALASAGNASGMSAYLGEKLIVMERLPSFLVLCLTSLFASLATELTSNVAICNIVSPVLIEMSLAMKVHPVQFTLPAAVMCSFAFLLPVGTPPNAIAAEAANIRSADMIKGGALLKLFSWAIYMALFPSYGRLFYTQGSMPDWASDTVTTVAATAW